VLLTLTYMMSLALSAGECVSGTVLNLEELEKFAAFLASNKTECPYEDGCVSRCAWRKTGQSQTTVNAKDFEMSVAQYWSNTSICADPSDPLMYHDSWCGVPLTVRCEPGLCVDNDKDGFYAWEETIALTSDDNAERLCTGVQNQFLCPFDQKCGYIEPLARWRCVEKNCEEESCDVFRMETVSLNNQELVVRVHMEKALVVKPSFLDLKIEYAHEALSLIDQRSVSVHPDLKIKSTYVDSGIVRITMYRTSGAVIQDGPLVELYFQRLSNDAGYVRFTQDDYAQTHSVAPRQGDVQEDLSDDAVWGEPIGFDERTEQGPRVLLHYTFDSENNDLSYADAPSADTLCGFISSCRQETNIARKKRFLSVLKDVQTGAVDISSHVEGVYGKAALFNGYSDHMEFPLTFNAPLSVLNQSYSWSSWFFAEGFSDKEPVGSVQLLMSHNNSSERTQMGLYLRKDASQKNILEFFVGSYQSPSNKYIVSVDFPSKSWVHVGLTLNVTSRVVSLYLDGKKILSTVPIGRSTQEVYACPSFLSPPAEGLSLHQMGDVIGGKLKGKVYFASNKNSKTGIASVDDNGSGLKDIVRYTDFSALDPDYNSVSDKIVYVSDVSGSYEIWVANGDGEESSRRKITDGFGNTRNKIFSRNPKWSPDGSAIVFESNAFDVSTGDNTLARVFHLYHMKIAIDENNDVTIEMPSGTVDALAYKENIRVLADKTTLHTHRFTQNQSQNHFQAQWIKNAFEKNGEFFEGQILINTADEFWKNNSTSLVDIASTLSRSVIEQVNLCPTNDERKILSVQKQVKPLTRDLATNDCSSTCASGTMCYRGECRINRDITQVMYTCFRKQRIWMADNQATLFSSNTNGCILGGASLRYGRDDNEDNVFDVQKELRDKKILCHSSSGNALIRKVTLQTSDTKSPCLQKGGMRIEWGHDKNKNAVFNDDEKEGSEVFCNGSMASYVKDLENPLSFYEIKDVYADDITAAAFSPDGERIMVAASYPKRPSLFKIDNPLSQSVSDVCRPNPTCGDGLKCISGKCVKTYIENLSEESIKVESISWKNSEAYYPCHWMGAYRQPQSAVMISGFKGAVDDVFLHSYVRGDVSFESEFSRGKQSLNNTSEENVLAQSCESSSDCSQFETCQSNVCKLSLVACDPEDANSCASGTCVPRPSTVALPQGESNPEKYAWVCASECSTLPKGVISTQCLSKECNTGMCQYCVSNTCVECTVDTAVNPSVTYGCPDRNAYYCSGGTCVSECYAYENNQSVYLCDPALQYCEQGRCLPNNWDWSDLSPGTFAGMGEMQFRTLQPYTTAIDELYPIEVTAYGIGDYARAPEVLVEAKMASPPQGAPVSGASSWFEIGRITVLNKTSSSAKQKPYVLQTPYRIESVRLRLQTPPSFNASFTSTGFLQNKEAWFYNTNWDALYTPANWVRRASGSRYVHTYSAAISPYLTPTQCIDAGLEGCDESFSLGISGYLRGGQDTVVIEGVKVNGDRPPVVANRICSYENSIEPLNGSDVEKKIYFGNVSREVSLQKARCGSACSSTTDELKTFDVTTKGFALLNCNFALDEDNTASYVGSGIVILPSYQRGNILETANGCFVENSDGMASPCYEWIGSDATCDPYDAGRDDEVLAYPQDELELTPASSFSSSNTAGGLVEVEGTNFVWSQLDSDKDGVPDDGDGSGSAFDNPCAANTVCTNTARALVKSILLKENAFCTSQVQCAITSVPSDVLTCHSTANVCVLNLARLRASFPRCSCDDNCSRQSNPDQQEIPSCSNDTDGDGRRDSDDNCPLKENADQRDTDSDGYGDECDQDDDADAVLDTEDNCPKASNRSQEDTDRDTRGDVCDDDIDNDGLCNVLPTSVSVCVLSRGTSGQLFVDNCPKLINVSQVDSDNDRKGNGCDIDLDNDGVCEREKRLVDEADTCVYSGGFDHCPNDALKSLPGECGCGVADTDIDRDGIKDCFDNCPAVGNSLQQNMDGDSQGDACDSDADGDNVQDVSDNCPLLKNAINTCVSASYASVACNVDADCFSANAACRSNVCVVSADKTVADDSRVRYVRYECTGPGNYCTLEGVCALQNNNDGDSNGDACDTNDDNDSAIDDLDNCDTLASADQSDNDRDGIGNVCDLDKDGDQIPDITDNCPWVSNPDQENSDLVSEGAVKYGNACDADDDNDGICESSPGPADTCVKYGGSSFDNCPTDANANQTNTDNDAYGDVCDLDDDNDGYQDNTDNCPLVSNANQADTDRDSVGNVCDNCPLVNNGNQADTDNDNIGDACDG
jgi:hypothetical protein